MALRLDGLEFTNFCEFSTERLLLFYSKITIDKAIFTNSSFLVKILKATMTSLGILGILLYT